MSVTTGDPLIWLAYPAAVASRIKLGTGVAVLEEDVVLRHHGQR